MKGIRKLRASVAMYFLPQCLFLRSCFSFLVSLSPPGAKLILREKQGLMEDGWRGKPTRPDQATALWEQWVLLFMVPWSQEERGRCFHFLFYTSLSARALGILSNQPQELSQLFSILSSTWLFLLCLQTWVSSFVLKKKKKKRLNLTSLQTNVLS